MHIQIDHTKSVCILVNCEKMKQCTVDTVLQYRLKKKKIYIYIIFFFFFLILYIILDLKMEWMTSKLFSFGSENKNFQWEVPLFLTNENYLEKFSIN